MPITLVPAEGSSIRNFQIVDTGSIFDGNIKVIKQGKFAGSKLSGPDCIITKYGETDINIRKGVFANGLENGTIFEYVFPQSKWEGLFVADSHILITRYTHVFSAGIWQSTSETTEKQITGTRTFNVKGYLVGFTFREL